jgi:phenylpyruvate tautomerase PptA (4-oxalocrotonate tautomerase family)
MMENVKSFEDFLHEDANIKVSDEIASEETVDEAMVQVAGKNKPSGAKVLATVIIEYMMKENYLKPGADAVKKDLIEDIAKVIMDSTF